MNRTARYPAELRERAVHMVFEHQDRYDSQWAAITAIATKLGMTPETLRKWVRRTETDEGLRPGLTSSERERLNALERENRELRRANEILKAATFFGAKLVARLSQVLLTAMAVQGAPCAGTSPRLPTQRRHDTPVVAPRRGMGYNPASRLREFSLKDYAPPAPMRQPALTLSWKADQRMASGHFGTPPRVLRRLGYLGTKLPEAC